MKRLIVEYLESKNEPELYRCGTCKYYSKCSVCSYCSKGSRWAYDTQFDEYDKADFEDWKNKRRQK